eukprot:scaffold3440_cov99-Cylindrotheca_fusiformis.AAC.1
MQIKNNKNHVTIRRSTKKTIIKSTNNNNTTSSNRFSNVSVLERLDETVKVEKPQSNPPSSQKKKPKKPKVTRTDPRKENKVTSSDRPIHGTGSSDDKDKAEEEAACCLCHSGIDCSDRALFFVKDRKKEIEEEHEDYYFQLDDPYLPEPLYDANNALVYCDSCDRMYHQKCHFVPILKLPAGDWNCLLCAMKVNNDKTLFASPPVPSSKPKELAFEYSSRAKKAQLWQQQLRSVKTFLSSQASNIRLAQAAMDTYTSTKRNRAMILASKSQELAQTLLRMTTGKFKMRQALKSLEDYRTSPSNTINANLLVDWCEKYPKHMHHAVPHGLEPFLKHCRTIPRTREMKQAEVVVQTVDNPVPPSIPAEIHCSSPTTTTATNGANGKKAILSTATTKPQTKNKNGENKKPNGDDDNDNDSGVTLDDLQCCICFVGDCTDDNDVILCDGEGCYRAYHMKCIQPAVKPEDVQNEDEDWFCPMCSSISNWTHQMQIACDPDFEDNNNNEDDIKEWENPNDIFPTSQWEYESAVKYSQGKRNEDTNALLAIYVGEDVVGSTKNQLPVGSDSEDENDYSLFDEESFAERKKKGEEEEGGEEDDDDDSMSDRSSKATWLSSSIDESIDRDELAALSEVEESDADGEENSDDSGSAGGSSNENERRQRRRKSRRLRSREQTLQQVTKTVGVEFDESNIVQGKRRRKPIDYRKLNDTLFGKLSEKESAKLDDGQDYKTKSKRKKRKHGSSSDDEKEKESSEKKKSTRNKRSKRSSAKKKDEEEDSTDGESDDNGSKSSSGGSNLESDDGSDSGNSDNESDEEEEEN